MHDRFTLSRSGELIILLSRKVVKIITFIVIRYKDRTNHNLTLANIEYTLGMI